MYHKLQHTPFLLLQQSLLAVLYICLAAPQISMNRQCCQSHKRFARAAFAIATARLMKKSSIAHIFGIFSFHLHLHHTSMH